MRKGRIPTGAALSHPSNDCAGITAFKSHFYWPNRGGMADIPAQPFGPGGLGFLGPTATRGTAVAAIASSFERGCEPRMVRALSLLSVWSCRAAERARAAVVGRGRGPSRTSWVPPLWAPSSPHTILSRGTEAISGKDIPSPAIAKKHSPAAAGFVMSRM